METPLRPKWQAHSRLMRIWWSQDQPDLIKELRLTWQLTSTRYEYS